MADDGPDRPWTEVDTLDEAVAALHEEAARVEGEPCDDWYARQLEAIRDLPREEPTVADAPGDVEELPPSAKLVWLYLRLHGPETQEEIAEGTRLSKRTARYGIGRLEEVDAIESTPYLRDARKDYYTALSDE